jgi:hypothetical protein
MFPRLNADSLAKELDAIGLRVGGSPFYRGTIACSGTEFCKLAITETKSFSRWLVEELEERLPGFDQHLKLHVTGCPNSCGQHWIADIGIDGKKMKVDGSWSTPITSASAARSACIRRPRGPVGYRCPRRKFPMRSSDCFGNISASAERARTSSPVFCAAQRHRAARVSGWRAGRRGRSRCAAGHRSWALAQSAGGDGD